LERALALVRLADVQTHEPCPHERLGECVTITGCFGGAHRFACERESALIVFVTSPQLAERAEELGTRARVTGLAGERERRLEVCSRGVEGSEAAMDVAATGVKPHAL